MFRRFSTSLAVAVLSLWLPSQALAVAPDPSLRPVAITAAAGTIGARVSPIPVLVTDATQTGGHIRIDNVSALIEDITIRTADYSIDAAGKPVAATADYPYGSASWYRFEAPDFGLPGGTSRDVAFNIVVPADAAAGDHFAALNVSVTAQPGQIAASGGATARSVLVLQSRLQHRIGGALPQTPTLTLTSATAPSAIRFTAHITNAGNTVVGHQAAPTPTLTLYDTASWGDPTQVARTIAVGGFYVAPRSIREVSVDWLDAPIIGQYRAVFTLPSADGQPEVTAETTVTIVNVPVLIGITFALALGLLVLTIFGVRRRSRTVGRLVETLPVVVQWPGE
jgi:hypothetical protein